ncbi:MAG: SpoIIIAH-like family protein [Tissierellia bacterium]|nr:SpoIIIAH-like family protein [Tissierellia bacterium]
MFTIKKPAIIIVLVLLLVLTGYINHNLTKQASARVSSDYQNYEEMEMAKEIQSDESLVPALSEDEEIDDFEILDSESADSLDDIITKAEEEISQTISSEDRLISKNYFIEQRLSRDKLRASLIDRLNAIVNNENSSQEMITEAQRKIMEIGNLSEKELTIEGLIKAKGFEEALVFLTANDAKIVVGKEELTEQDVVKILEIVLSETDLDAENVNIMKKN